LGLNKHKSEAQDEGKSKTRGWVRREQNRSEPKGESEEIKKKVAKASTMSTVEAGS